MKLSQFRRLGLSLILITVLEAVVSGQPGTTAFGGTVLGRLTSASGAQEHGGLRLISSTPTSMSLDWVAPDLQVDVDAQGFLVVQAQGLDQTGQPGELRLPVDGYLLALPVGALPQIEVLFSQEGSQLFLAPLAINPQPQGVLTGEKGEPVGGAWAEVEGASAAAVQEQQRDSVYLEEAGVFRGVRLARLVFHPALPDGNNLRLIQRMQVKIAWGIPVIADPNVNASEAKQSLPSQDPLLGLLQNQVINPWMVFPDTGQPQAEADPPSPQPGIYLEIDHSGLYRLGYQELQPYGLTSFNPANLRLYRGAEEVAYAWQGNGDAVFESNETLLFYAERRFSRWTALDVYRLVYDPSGIGSRMATLSAAPFGLPAGVPQVEVLGEENLVYTPDCFCKALPGRDGDHWVWHKLAQPDQNSVALSFIAPAANTGVPAQLTLLVISYSDRTLLNPDHQVKAILNSFDLGTLSWDGKKAVALTFAIPAGVLHSGQNTLNISLPMNVQGYYDQFWLDAFQVRYVGSALSAGQEVFFQAESGGSKAYTLGFTSGGFLALDVTNGLYPALLDNFIVSSSYQVTLKGEPSHKYWLASSAAVSVPRRIRLAIDPWHYQPGGAPAGADYVIITHPDFATALQPLVTLRQSQGYSVAVVNVLGIYDTWGDGRIDPQAIRTFLADAYASWQPRPTFVLLVGDGSSDPRQYVTAQTTFIPPYLANADPWAGETAADNRYVAVAGADFVPDMLLGRLPVQSLAQAQAVVSKILQYEANAQPSPWNANVLMISDDRDPAGDFYALNSTSSGFVASPFRPITLACPNQAGEPPYLDNCPASTAQQIHASLQNLWPTGPFLIQYAGHSSWQQWAAERYFHLDDLPALHDARQPTVVLEMTCFTGAFQRLEPTLDESLVLLPGNGAVAAWGSTGLGVSTGHDSLSHGFFQAVFQEGVLTLGEAALAGKLELLKDKSPYLDLLDTFNILGDPALHFNRQALPWSSEVFLPVISR